MKLGKAKYSEGKKTFKLLMGDNVYRILPPMGKNSENGKWYEYYRVEWGFKGTDGKMKPFQDVRKTNFKTRMVEVESAAFLNRERLMELKKSTIEAFKAGKATREQVQAISEESDSFNIDSKYYLNAVNANGEIGLLKLNATLMKALRVEIDKARKLGKDPLSAENGMFFNFSRSNETGKIHDWIFSVTPFQKEIEATVNGQIALVKQDVLHSIDDNFISRLGSEAFELSGMYPLITPEEVERIVKEGPLAVDELLGSKPKTKAPEVAVAERAEAVAPIQETSVSEEIGFKPLETDVVTEAIAAPIVETPTTVIETAPVADSAGGTVSDADFLASIGAGQ